MSSDILSRYEQAQELMQGVMTNKIVMNDAVFPHWSEGSSCFWYKRDTPEGNEYRKVDASIPENVAAFDHRTLAEVLEIETGKRVDHKNLPIKNLSISESPSKIRFDAFGKHWSFDLVNKVVLEEPAEEKQKELRSPDGRNSVFIREHNLWLRNLITGQEKPLTSDGNPEYSYGSDQYISALMEVQAIWSPDSNRLFTLILDTREVALRPHIQYAPRDGSLHPKLSQTKRSYPGDKNVETYRLLCIDISTEQVRLAEYGQIPFFAAGKGFFTDEKLGWWSCDCRNAYFVDVSRGANSVRVVKFDTSTGHTHVLFEETSNTFVKLTHSAVDAPLFLALPESDELIWFSERSGWMHIYLYDLTNGKLKHAITEGDWLVRDIIHFCASKREVLIRTAARNKEINPYYCDICVVNVDSGNITSIASGNYDHVVYRPLSNAVLVRRLFGLDSSGVSGVSNCGQYIVMTRSRVDCIPVSVLIDRNGNEVLIIEEANTSGLPKNWVWPEPVKLKSADGKTDTYGVVYRPPGFSSKQSYPVLDFSNSMRGVSTVPQGSFINGPVFGYLYMLGAALAALGFIVVAIEGRGTPLRDKAFQDYNYGDIASSGDCDDRVVGIQKLATQYPYMDLERVGITCMDMLTTSVYGLLNHPEFYKVGVVHCYHDPRFTHSAEGEKYDGIMPNMVAKGEGRYADENVEALKGKLLIIHGMLDPFTPSGMFRLVEALQRANKDFDMICLPNEVCDMPDYALRRNWDYLVKHLQGIEPPHEFHLTTTQYINDVDYLYD